MLISDAYKEQNKQLHEQNLAYGVTGKMHAPKIMELAYNLKTQDVLDYGCGKATLSQNLPFAIKNYDPAVPKYAAEPEPADIVTCTDVLEHVEPECIDAVLKHIASLTKKVCFLQIANGAAKKTLPDGRNAHLIQESASWWFDKISKHQLIINFQLEEQELGEAFQEYIMVCRPL